LSEALEFNQKLWSIFQSSVAAEDHPYPQELRTAVLRLGLFIDKRIFDVMAYPAPEKLNAIIGINQNLAAGLRLGAGTAENWKPVEAEAGAHSEEPVWA
jgi:flagellar protein FlaF